MSLVCHDVSFSYDPSVPVLDHVSLSVDRGERVALVAPSGFGKTTLCRILAGYLVPASGSVEVDGSLLPQKGLRPVQLIWQQPELAFDPRLRMERSLTEVHGYDEAYRDELMEEFGVAVSWLSRFPSELSGGELMRFCIVRALLGHPSYLICDEMTAMLDAITQAFVWKRLLAVSDRTRMGLLVVSHSPALVERVSTRCIDLTRLSEQVTS